jgi:hypothetical protein
MAEIIFSSEITWIKTDSDNQKCASCKEIIYGTMFHPVLSFGHPIEETEFVDIQVRLCVPCYDATFP